MCGMCQYFCLPSYIVLLFQLEDHLSQLPIHALPGVGHALQEKLKKQNFQTCGQLMMISKVLLFIDLFFLMIFFFLFLILWKFSFCSLTPFWRSFFWLFKSSINTSNTIQNKFDISLLIASKWIKFQNNVKMTTKIYTQNENRLCKK